ncbi:Splicing factor U2AF-associated protein 2 [Penicillium subrubescens]|uniref:Splicing factor U2AF-associated protein 2 n=1 Tax=Penicillium subrubescens TaxID=1316194 RepID=UPI0025456987|nr:Splicing factor U2AF-associated protein 2 [Penicillium subrubescens]KAJ5883717.1 Splicing factor U2AF-associated protein 2 [Penicillium subrubescens]
MASQGASTDAPAFPQDPAEFDSDPRISWSRLDEKFILETEDGQEFEYDSGLKRWVFKVDEELLKQQQEAYKVAGVDEDEMVNPREMKKRKLPAGDAKGNKAKKPRVNSAIWITGLPQDTKRDEIEEKFSRWGVISREIDSGGPRIKMYYEEDGTFKGEALVVYFRPESVNLAIQMVDETDFRGGQGTMRVQAAELSFKSQTEAPAKPAPRDRRKVLERTEEMNRLLTDWDDDDPLLRNNLIVPQERTVVLKGLFTLEELKEDVEAILDIKEDVRTECSKIGEVTNVVLYDLEPEGVVTVKFAQPDDAQACVTRMDGRFFGGTQIKAYIQVGREKFKKTNERRAALEDMAERGLDADNEEENQRLQGFGDWLESEK